MEDRKIKFKEMIREKISYQIEDWFDNGERRGDKMLYDDGKKLADLIEKKVVAIFDGVRSDIRTIIGDTDHENGLDSPETVLGKILAYLGYI